MSRELACEAERDVLVSSDLFKEWLRSLPTSHQGVTLYGERPGARAVGLNVPIKKLRWKSDRQMAMHGNDVIGVDATKKPVRVLKGERKSRATCGNGAVEEAVESLDLHDGRPNPSTLAFIAKRLYEEKRDEEANVFRDLQCGGAIVAKNVTHMIFALSGNDPAKHLAGDPHGAALDGRAASGGKVQIQYFGRGG